MLSSTSRRSSNSRQPHMIRTGTRALRASQCSASSPWLRASLRRRLKAAVSTLSIYYRLRPSFAVDSFSSLRSSSSACMTSMRSKCCTRPQKNYLPTIGQRTSKPRAQAMTTTLVLITLCRRELLPSSSKALLSSAKSLAILRSDRTSARWTIRSCIISRLRLQRQLPWQKPKL